MSNPNALEQNTLNFFSDLEKIRLTAEDMGDISTKEILSLVPVRRPRKGEFFRAHPDPAMSLTVAIYQDPDEPDEVYFVAPSMRDELAEDMKAVHLQLCISRKGVLFIWPLTVPKEGNSQGRSWHESARKAAEISKTKWVRIHADKGLSGYRIRQAEGDLGNPEWLEGKGFSELLAIAFGDRIIADSAHPVAQKLRGLKW
jgi:hypothetical protein